MTAIVIAGGKLFDAQKIIGKISNYSKDLIIACDHGYDNSKLLGLNPHIIVGDLDSIKGSVCDSEIIKLPCQKDETDLRVGIDIAVDKKCTNIVILCATGGRLDHFYGNVSNLEYLHDKKINATIIDEQNIITISDKNQIYKNISKYVSIIPIGEKIIFSTESLKYSAKNLEVCRKNIISISNESESEFFSIDIKKGKALIIQSDDK